MLILIAIYTNVKTNRHLCDRSSCAQSISIIHHWRTTYDNAHTFKLNSFIFLILNFQDVHERKNMLSSLRRHMCNNILYLWNIHIWELWPSQSRLSSNMMANWCDAFTLESLPNFREYDTLSFVIFYTWCVRPIQV